MSQYEEFIIDRREKFFEDSAKYRNDANDFNARFNRGEAIIKDMRERLIAGTDWKKIGLKAKRDKEARVFYAKFGGKRA